VGPRTILVNPRGTKLEPPAGVGLYARVSSHDQKADLDRQVPRLSERARKAQASVVQTEAEAGSGMNGARRKVQRLWRSPTLTHGRRA